MAAESDLYLALTQSAEVVNIVGGNIFSDLPGENATAPFIFFERIDTDVVHTIHSGLPLAEITQLSIICYAKTRESAEELADLCVVAADQGNLIYTGRQGEYDDESRLFAAVLLVQHNK